LSLPHVLLGMLAEPASGYDLKNQFEQSVRYFWYAELSQIYPALSKLEKDGLLKSKNVPSDKGPARKIYSRTAKGTLALKEWISEGPVCRTERLAYLTQVFFLNEVNLDRRISFMDELRVDFEERLTELKEIDSNWKATDPRYPDELPDSEFYAQFTLRCGLMKYQVLIDWCQECIDRMEKRRNC
jgi:PadR family transcriptional regulator AphA